MADNLRERATGAKPGTDHDAVREAVAGVRWKLQAAWTRCLIHEVEMSRQLAILQQNRERLRARSEALQANLVATRRILEQADGLEGADLQPASVPVPARARGLRLVR